MPYYYTGEQSHRRINEKDIKKYVDKL
jgi:hypothetical protein